MSKKWREMDNLVGAVIRKLRKYIKIRRTTKGKGYTKFLSDDEKRVIDDFYLSQQTNTIRNFIPYGHSFAYD